jgi:hypothetical protein
MSPKLCLGAIIIGLFQIYITKWSNYLEQVLELV